MSPFSKDDQRPLSITEVVSRYKLVYLDTNVVSDLSKGTDLVRKLVKKYPPSEYLLSFSTFTFYEIYQSALYPKFLDVFSVYPCAILKSHVPLIQDEIHLAQQKIAKVNPVVVVPLAVKGAGESFEDVLRRLMAPHEKETYNNINQQTVLLFRQWSGLRNEPKLAKVFSGKATDANKFVPSFREYEYRRLNGPQVSISNLNALEILSYGIYYKFVSDPKQTKKQSDVFDILIMTTVPYVDVFISEGNSIEILKKIKRQTNIIDKTELVNISELRKVVLNQP